MLEEAHFGILFRPSESIKNKYNKYYNCNTYTELSSKIEKVFNINKDI